MDIINEIGNLLPELLKLGGWGAMVILFLTRRVITKQELDEAKQANEERVADKDKQIVTLTKAVQDGDAAMERLAVAWEAAIALVIRDRKEGR